MAVSLRLAATITDTYPPLALHGDLYPVKRAQNRTRKESEGSVHGERNSRKVGGLAPMMEECQQALER